MKLKAEKKNKKKTKNKKQTRQTMKSRFGKNLRSMGKYEMKKYFY